MNATPASPPSVAARSAPSSRRGLSDRPLTPKQLDALTRAAYGATHKQIATAHGIDVKTVGGIFQEIFRKVGGAQSTAHAVLLACQAGILDGRPRRHGDHAGYEAHRRRGEVICEPCRVGERAHRAAMKKRTRT